MAWFSSGKTSEVEPQPDFINKRLSQKDKGKPYINNVYKAMLDYFWVFDPYLLNLSYQSFTIKQKTEKIVSCYVLKYVQNWQHIFFTSLLNK